jgi:uncharacterized membrane protein YhaH (DUF805 family)
MGVLRLLFDFRGRIDRRRYWMGLASIYLGAPLVLGALLLSVFGSPLAMGQEMDKGMAILGFIGGLLMVFVVSSLAAICTMALAAKRLHDLNLTGFFCLAIPLAPSPLGAMGMLGAMQMGGGSAPWYAPGYVFLAVGVLAVLGVIGLGFIPGKSGPNQCDHPRTPQPATIAHAPDRPAQTDGPRASFGLRGLG